MPQPRPSREGQGSPFTRTLPRRDVQAGPQAPIPSAPAPSADRNDNRSRVIPSPQRSGSSRSGTGGAPISRLRPQEPTGDRGFEQPLSRTPRTEQRSDGTRDPLTANIRTRPTPGAPIHSLRGMDRPRLPDPRPSDPPRDRDWDRGHDRDRDHDRGRDWRDRDRHDGRWDGRRDHDWRHRDWDRSRHWHGSHWRHDRHHSWRHRDRWSISFSLAPSLYYSTWRPFYGYGTSLYYTPSYWGSSYYSYSYSDPLCYTTRYSYYRSPLTYSLSYPIYEPAYSSTTYIYTDDGSYSQGYADGLLSGTYRGQLLDYSSKAAVDYRAYATPSYEPAPAIDEAIVVYGASSARGTLAWSDTPISIVNDVLRSADRARVAQRYLGKSVQGAWEVTLDQARALDNGVELTCRGMADSGTGARPTIIVVVPRGVGDLVPGQRLSVTGRLMELSVNDPQHPGGMLVLEDGDVSW